MAIEDTLQDSGVILLIEKVTSRPGTSEKIKQLLLKDIGYVPEGTVHILPTEIEFNFGSFT
jgi:hypothetical protein